MSNLSVLNFEADYRTTIIDASRMNEGTLCGGGERVMSAR
jgi:hypothetical protein